MKKYLILAASAGLACAEGPSGSVDAQPTRKPAPVVDASLPKTRLVPLDSTVKTSAGSRPRFDFVTSAAAGPASDTAAALLKTQARFVGADNTIIPTVVAVPNKGNPNEVRFSVEPAEDLADDSWYWLVVEPSTNVSVGVTEGTYTQRFYTSSAPHVVEIEVAKGSAYIRLSEAVDLRTVDGTQLLKNGKLPISGCTSAGAGCVGGTASPQWLSSFVVSLPSSATALSLSLEHVGKWQGSARAFSEIPASAGISVTETIPPGTWESCQNGGASCWRVPFHGTTPIGVP